jgi:HSP20 family molecular chaperone IbpA
MQVFSQTNLDLDTEVKEMIQRQRELINSMMKDQEDFDKHVKKLFERLQKQGAFQGLNQRLFQFTNAAVKTTWIEEGKRKKLVLDLDPKKDKVNIDINDGSITIKGQRTIMDKFKGSKNSYSQSVHSFQQSLTIPHDVDESSAQFKSENGKVVIVFNKKTLKKSPIKNLKTKGKSI